MKNRKNNNNDCEKQPGPVYATNGSFPGEIFLHWDAVQEAGRYIIEISGKKNKRWERLDIVKDPVYCISGLKPGKEYSFRIAAELNNCITPWSNEVLKKIK